jgi:hypothetical protein
MLIFSVVVQAQSFSKGNLAILRVGDGVQNLTNTGNTLFIDEYTPQGGLVRSIALPDQGADALLLSGVAGTEGGLTRSADQTTLAMGGYNVGRDSVAGSLSSQSATAVPRAIGTISSGGAYAMVQSSTTLFNQSNIRCAVTDGTNDFWAAGGNSGTIYLRPPESTVTVQSSIANTRYVRIVNGNLYFSTQAGAAGIYTFQGGGLPREAAVTNLFIATGNNSQPAGFDINSALTIAYIADQRNSAGGIQKWTNNGTAWGLAYTFATGAGAFSLVADFNGNTPVIYAITGEGSSNRLLSIVDTGASSVTNLLATAGSNRVFRGVDFAPEVLSTVLPVSLNIERSGNNVFISWPSAAGSYVLETNPSLVQPGGWSDVGAPVTSSNGTNFVILPASSPGQFFRLRQ